MQNCWQVPSRFLGKLLFLGFSSTLLAVAAPASGQAAERVAFRYGPFQRSISVADLQTYAETGEAPPELAVILRRIPSESRESVQQLLQAQLPVTVVTLDRFLRTPQGQGVLNQIADITVREDEAGVQAVRGASIVAAALPGGLSVLNFLKAYPSPTITLSLPETLAFVRESQGLLQGAAGALQNPGGQGQPIMGPEQQPSGQPMQPPQ